MIKSHIKTYALRPTEQKLFYGLLAAMFLFSIIYGYFVNATIVNIVERKDMQYEAGELHASISNLEREHGLLRQRITYGYAHELGFSEPEKYVYVSEKRLVSNSINGF